MTSATAKIGRTLMAVLLAAFVCVTPAVMPAAYADETTEQTDLLDGIDTTGMTEDQIQELLKQKLLEKQAAQNLETESVTDTDATEGTDETDETDAGEEPTASDETEATDEASDSNEAESTDDATETTEVNVGDLLSGTDGTDQAALLDESKATATGDVPAAAERDGNTFKVGTYMQLHDVFKYDINSQSNQEFVISLIDDVTLEAPSTYVLDDNGQKVRGDHGYVKTQDTQGNNYTTGTDALCVKNGNTVTILGNGHSIIYTDKTVNNITPGTMGGNLILGAADGSDSLTLTFTGTNHDLGSLVDVTGGTLAIHSGVTLSNNVNYTGYPGGGVDATNGAVVTMDGGLIEGNSNANITWGGGVNVDGATFNMTGGTIRGNSETTMGDYLGYGGGVSLGAHGDTSVFNMSGNAVIEGNTAPNGGGVYVGSNSTFNMDGNASIRNNTGSTYGGGVYVAQGGTFTMGENATITGNNSPYGGGVINFGTATISNVYDNDASTAGADVYNNGTLTMEPVKAEWSLSREQATSDPDGVNGSGAAVPTDKQPDLPGIKFQSLVAMPEATAVTASDDAGATTTTSNPSNTTIDDWYYDGHREANGNVETNRWNANEDTADTPQYLVHYTPSDATTETMGLKAAHGAAATTTPTDPTTPETPETVNVYWENYDGTVLFELDKVAVGHVPEATEYNALSGKDDPTEPADGATKYEFDGWEKTVEPNGDVIYTAQYEPENPTDPTNPTDPVNPKTPDDPTDPVIPTTPTDPAQPTQPTSSATTTPTPYTPNSAKTTETGAALQQTGDNALVAGGLAAGAIALVALGGIAIARRKNSED